MNNIDELLFSAIDTDDNKLLTKLLASLKSLKNLDSVEIKAGIELLLENWSSSIASSSDKSQFCFELAQLNPTDSPALRIALQRAFSNLNTSLFPRSTVVKATAVKDYSAKLSDVVEHFHVLRLLKNGVKVFNPNSKRFGTIQELDDMTSEVSLTWDGSGLQSSVMTLEATLKELTFFKDDKIIAQFAKDPYKITATQWCDTLKKNFISFPNTLLFKDIALAIAATSATNMSTFNKWWEGKNSDVKAKPSGERHPSSARTIHELQILLKKYKRKTFTPEECAQMALFFEKVKPNLPIADALFLIESTIILSEYISQVDLINMLQSVKETLSFWPKEDELYNIDPIVWSKLPAKSLPKFANITLALFSVDYLAKLTLHLPIRCWNSIISVTSIEIIANEINESETITSDAVMWIWRNRKKLDVNTIKLLNPVIITDVINEEISDSNSQASQLKELLISNKEFHTIILDNIKGNEMDLLRAIQTCTSLRMDEQQSLLVKCSALSSAVKDCIEKGDGKKMFSSAGKQHMKQMKENELSLTSLLSFKKINEELQDLISVQMPENTAAIAHARSYGDLKENAEYKAAKERQAFLGRRRAELERNIVTTQPTDFSDVAPKNIAIPGSTVELTYVDDKSVEIFYLLGVWDSDPDRNHLSCKSRLGLEIRDKAIGDSIELPDGRKAKLTAVKKLPKDLLQLLGN